MTINKYEIASTGRCSVEMPAGAVVLHAAEMLGLLYVFAAVTPEHPPESMTFHVYYTDATINNAHVYVGTVQRSNGYFHHVFQVP
jgi:hypothetical protein